MTDRTKRNGFAALAYYDTADGGGNGDGKIDSSDAVFSKLRVWVDANQNGISETGELFTLRELGIESISLIYREARREDQWGNKFRYAGSLTQNGRQSEKIYDVFLRSATMQSKGGK